jgi:pimeloyl-ACP methyl ester carboxylesterase
MVKLLAELPMIAGDRLTEPESIAQFQAIQRQPIPVDLPGIASPQAIATSFVQLGGPPGGSTSLPVLLIHGFDSSLLEYRRLQPRLAGDRPTWAVDLLGFGFTDRPTGIPYDATAIRAHLHAFWQTQIGRPVAIVGASMGGVVAMDFAVAHPEAVAQVVLLDSAGFVNKPLMSRFLVPPLGQLGTGFLANRRVRDSIGRNAYADPSWANEDAYWCGALHLAMPRWSEALIAFTRSGGCTILGDRIAQVRQPTLILWGEQDRILGTANAPRLTATLPQSRLEWIPNCGHVPHLECAAVTAGAIARFLQP